MFGVSYGEILVILGAAAALIGPKDLPRIGRTAGRMAGRAIGYVQIARGHLDTVFQQSQARQVHKELQDTLAQIEAIRHEIRSISLLNPAPLTRRFVDAVGHQNETNVVATDTRVAEDLPGKIVHIVSPEQGSCNMLSQATTFAKLAKASLVHNGSSQPIGDKEQINSSHDPLNVLPVSAESAGMLPDRPANATGSDIMLEAIIEAEVAQSAQKFFAQPENQINFQ